MGKKISLQDIADSLGISRGTVDRAIHGRGRINSETRERVIVEARRLGYIDRKLNSYLPLQQENNIIVIIPDGDPFFLKIEEGIYKAVNDMALPPKLEIEHISLDQPELQSESLLSIAEDGGTASGLLIVPSEDPKLCEAITAVEAAGIRVITVNTDAPASGRSLFVGQDLYASGRTAGELMLRMNDSTVAVLSGFDNIWGHSERVRGFIDVYRENDRLKHIIGPYFTHDDINETSLILNKIPDRFSGVYSVSGLTTEGAGRFLSKRNNEDITLVGFDCTEENVELLESGAITSLISQSPQLQGFLSVLRLMRIIKGEPDSVADDINIPIDIYFKENIRFYRNHLELF